MSDESSRANTEPEQPREPWQGEWPGTGPAPTEAERDIVEREMAEGTWSESRQRADWTGAHHEERPHERAEGADRDNASEQGRASGERDIARQVEQGDEAPS
jgi:hypothetical protein